MAIPVMREIAAEFHETVLLTKRLGSAIICLEREEWPGQYVRLSYERGSRLSLNAGASALVLLAWLPERYVRELVASENLVSYTNKTLTGAQEILDRLAQIRRDGFSVARGDVDTNTMAIAAPIFDSHGDVSAALSLVMLDSRLTEAEQPAAIVKLVECADRVSADARNFSE
jgi:DNA-binding IclR family transcriptional regulator